MNVLRAFPASLALTLLANLAPDTALPQTSGAEDKPVAQHSITTHRAIIGGKSISYTAKVGWLLMDDDAGRPVAQFGYTEYVRDGFDDKSQRPVVFAWNGGPGSSSIYLHMAALGPRLAVTTDTAFTNPSSYGLKDNANSILDVADLVMVDPVGTGFSRPIGDASGKQFWGVDQDIESVSRFIKTWITQNGRWHSPKYILGESYGSQRAGGVAWELLSSHNIALHGVVLVAPFMSYVHGGFDDIGIDLANVLFMPTFATTALYHRLITYDQGDLESFSQEVEEFAYGEYASALLRGARLSDADRTSVVEKLARYTGLSEDYWQRANLRVTHLQFTAELLRRRGETVGRVDSRYTGPNLNLLGESAFYDPFNPAVVPALTASLMDYFRDELDFAPVREYKVSGRIWYEWDWSHAPPTGGPFGAAKVPFSNTGPDLAMAMRQNPHMRVLVQQGYFDLATPHLATEYFVEHLDLPPESRPNISIEYYEAGHMPYVHPPSHDKFKRDLADFIDQEER